jgi:multisubunit Na+/H+ antiporter MnhB subunit
MTILLVLLLLGLPSVAFWLLVPQLDPIGRLVVTTAASPTLVSAVAGVMLVTGLWSPGGGLAAVFVISGLMVLAALAHRARRKQPAPLTVALRPAVPPKPKPAIPAAGPEENDEWIFRA